MKYCEKCGAVSPSNYKCFACHAKFADKCVVIGAVVGTIIAVIWGI